MHARVALAVLGHALVYGRVHYMMPQCILLCSVHHVDKVRSCSVLRNLQASRPDAPGHFYDVWVMRDVEGHIADINPPYLHHAYSRFRLEQGLPFPVSCCWNGMISLDAQPFAEGLRFRSAACLEPRIRTLNRTQEAIRL